MFGLEKVMGEIMEFIYNGLSFIGIHNIGLSIIFFTIIVYCLMLPMTIKQQKFTKMSAAMNPEIQAIQKKYKNKKDQASMMKMQEETKMIYAKYGTSPTGGCLVTLIQFPILFALWPAINGLYKFVDKVGYVYKEIANKILEHADKINILNKIGVKDADKIDQSGLVDYLYKNLNNQQWDTIKNEVAGTADNIHKAKEMNRFLFFDNIADTPGELFSEAWSSLTGKGFTFAALLALIIAISIPVLSALSQWISMKITQNMQNSSKGMQDNPAMGGMGFMTNVMPLLSLFMCFTFPVGLGLYWVASAVVRTIQQILINKKLDKKPLEQLIEENKKKAEKKASKKKAVESSLVNQRATQSTRKITSDYQGDTYRSNAKQGSLASKANLVSDFNKKNNK